MDWHFLSRRSSKDVFINCFKTKELGKHHSMSHFAIDRLFLVEQHSSSQKIDSFFCLLKIFFFVQFPVISFNLFHFQLIILHITVTQRHKN